MLWIKVNVCQDERRNLMKYLAEGVLLSEYNEGTEEQIDYYVSVYNCKVGGEAYMYSHADDSTMELEVIHVVRRSDDVKFYDELSENENVLIEGEYKYHADTSAEFITEDDCYLIWFQYLSKQRGAEPLPAMREKVMQKWKNLYHEGEGTMVSLLQFKDAAELTCAEKEALLAWCGDDDYAFVDASGRICLKNEQSSGKKVL